MKRLAVLLTLAVLAVPAGAVIEAYQFDDPAVEADYKRLIAELRCLVCQNQNLAESDADLARDLRRETFEMLTDGQSPQQIIDFTVARYGDFVLYRPQFKSSTWLLWLGPFVLLSIVLVVVILRLRGAARQPQVDAGAVEEARRLLEQDESRR